MNIGVLSDTAAPFVSVRMAFFGSALLFVDWLVIVAYISRVDFGIACLHATRLLSPNCDYS